MMTPAVSISPAGLTPTWNLRNLKNPRRMLPGLWSSSLRTRWPSCALVSPASTWSSTRRHSKPSGRAPAVTRFNQKCQTSQIMILNDFQKMSLAFVSGSHGPRRSWPKLAGRLKLLCPPNRWQSSTIGTRQRATSVWPSWPRMWIQVESELISPLPKWLFHLNLVFCFLQ